MPSSPLMLIQAAHFAAEKHKKQLRKGLDATPYINHPLNVARILAEEGGVVDHEVLAAALLHDTIEDTQTTFQELRDRFGEVVAQYVQEVTDDKSIKEKAERKRLQIEHAPHKSQGAALVKLADKTSNIRDVGADPPAHWDKQRRLEYLDWAEKVVEQLPIKDHQLNGIFERSLAEARVRVMSAEKRSSTSS